MTGSFNTNNDQEKGGYWANWSGWISNTPTELRVVIIVSIFAAIILCVLHRLIIWGALARA